MEMNVIRIHRKKSYADKMRTYKVILDGKQVAEVKEGCTVDFEVSEGMHNLKIKIDWCESPSVEFAANGGEITFECGSNLNGIKVFFGIFYILFRRKHYVWLRKV